MKLIDMTEKEKAQQLVQKYYDSVTDHMTWEQAKECARIAVSEVINQLNVAPLFNGSRTPEADKVWAYWVEVEQEIIKL